MQNGDKVGVTSPGHMACLVAAMGMPLNKCMLAYHEAPPAASATTLIKQREIACPLYSRSGALPSSLGAVTNMKDHDTTGASAPRSRNG